MNFNSFLVLVPLAAVFLRWTFGISHVFWMHCAFE